MEDIKKVVQLKKELDALRPLSKEDEIRIMQKFRLDWNYHSNHIEGNSLTYGETKALILFGITAQGKPLKDHFEVTGHNEAVEWVLEVVKQDRPLTENFIRELHKLILKESYEVNAISPEGLPTKKKIEIGKYKETPNHVKTITGEIFRFATPEETPALMHDLLEWYRNTSKQTDLDPILLATEFHYRFIRIHPFDDGNGRTARIIMNFILMQHAYPPVIIKTEEKEEYYSVLRQADAGLLKPFIEFITKNLANSLELMVKGAKGESVDDPGDLDKEIALLKQEFNSLDKPIEEPKSQEKLLGIYDESITKLTRKFIENGELFSGFYAYSKFKFLVADYLTNYINNPSIEEITGKNSHYFTLYTGLGYWGTSNTKENWKTKSRVQISGSTSRINMTWSYDTLKQKNELGETDYKSELNLEFAPTQYLVKDKAEKIIIIKSYSEQLTDKEIDQLVNGEIQRHKAFIQTQMELIKNKKNKE